jgi:putative phage-type endonuclease
MEQRTPEWFAARLGRVTASRVADVVAKTKTGYGSGRANYMAELICERLTGTQGAFYSNAAIQWGVEKEPDARAAYEEAVGMFVVEVGFIPHNTISMAGASPDGLVGDGGLVEIKCPNTATHIDTLLSGFVPNKYINQMQWQMACTGRQWCDFVSFDPRMPEGMQIWVKRVERDNVLIAELEKEVISFLVELQLKIAQLKEKTGGI